MSCYKCNSEPAVLLDGYLSLTMCRLCNAKWDQITGEEMCKCGHTADDHGGWIDRCLVGYPDEQIVSRVMPSHCEADCWKFEPADETSL